MLAVPLPPTFKIFVSLLSFFEIYIPAELFSIPYVHVIRYLVSFHLHGKSTGPIWNPGRSVPIMIHDLFVFLFRQYVVAENNREDRALQENEDCAAAQLDDSHIKCKYMPKYWQLHVVVYISHTDVLFFGIVQDKLFIQSLFEIPSIFCWMLKHLPNVLIISPLPFCLPKEINYLNLWNHFSVYIFKMEDISPILWDVLDMSLNLMNCSCSIFQTAYDGAKVYHRINGFLLVLLHGMNPHIHIPVQLTGRVLSQAGCLVVFLHPIEFLVLLTEVGVVLNVFHLHGLAVVVDADASLPVVQPAVEGALDALLIDHLPSHSQVRTQMFAVRFQGIGLSFLRSEHYNIFPSNIDGQGVSFQQICRPTGNIPTIRVWWKWIANIFALGIIVSSSMKNNSLEVSPIQEIENNGNQSINQVGKF